MNKDYRYLPHMISVFAYLKQSFSFESSEGIDTVGWTDCDREASLMNQLVLMERFLSSSISCNLKQNITVKVLLLSFH